MSIATIPMISGSRSRPWKRWIRSRKPYMQISSRFDVKIIRKKNNKKMYMRYKDGAVIVTAPSFVSDERISRFIAENEKWIEEQCVKEEQT
ncbi:YgjP-like metallopeptidase domain-containing protein, partial [uncultured Dubosiella sp.]|uniref:YgjP-like metallopeptidase domain-containing protein n=1 Tax=uncultured Dubosiella sp. TaxID=1937011 RepID=UPI00345D70A5